MEKTQAIQILNLLVEHAMAAGMFKDFKNLDHARQALITIEKEVYKVSEPINLDKHLPGTKFSE